MSFLLYLQKTHDPELPNLVIEGVYPSVALACKLAEVMIKACYDYTGEWDKEFWHEDSETGELNYKIRLLSTYCTFARIVPIKAYNSHATSRKIAMYRVEPIED